MQEENLKPSSEDLKDFRDAGEGIGISNETNYEENVSGRALNVVGTSKAALVRESIQDPGEDGKDLALVNNQAVSRTRNRSSIPENDIGEKRKQVVYPNDLFAEKTIVPDKKDFRST